MVRFPLRLVTIPKLEGEFTVVPGAAHVGELVKL
jgi:hypothetical protein